MATMKASTILGGVLVVQLLLAAGIGWSRNSAGDDMVPQPLLDFAAGDVNRIEIDDNTNQVILAKDGADWLLPARYGLAANRSRIERLLENLAELETGWPVATTSGSIDRLEVAADNYQRHLRLLQGDRLLGEYYFGTSPGLRQTHGRRGGEDAVYALAINNFDLPGDSNDWLDKTLLSLDSVTRISGADYALVPGPEEDSWRFDQVENGNQALDADKADRLVAAIADLRVLRVADALPDVEPVEVTVSDAENSWTYSFYADDEKYYVKRHDMDAAFTISKSSYDRIAGVDHAGLLMEQEEAAPETEEDNATA